MSLPAEVQRFAERMAVPAVLGDRDVEWRSYEIDLLTVEGIFDGQAHEGVLCPLDHPYHWVATFDEDMYVDITVIAVGVRTEVGIRGIDPPMAWRWGLYLPVFIGGALGAWLVAAFLWLMEGRVLLAVALGVVLPALSLTFAWATVHRRRRRYRARIKACRLQIWTALEARLAAPQFYR